MDTTSTKQEMIRKALNGNDSVIPASRIYALSIAGYTQAKIANEVGATPAAVNQVIHDKTNSFNIASFIASVLGVRISQIWPDGRYSTPPKKTREAA